MKRIVVFLALLLLFLLGSVPCFGEALQKVHLDWEYEDQVVPGESLAGFRLYRGDVMVCEIGDPAARSADCRFAAADGMYSFTLTAFYSGGTETPHSEPYAFTLSVATHVVEGQDDAVAAGGGDAVADGGGDAVSDGNGDGRSTLQALADQAEAAGTLSRSVYADDFSLLDDGAGNELLPVLIYPLALAAGSLATEICIINTSGEQSLRGVLRPYRFDGSSLGSDLVVDLPPHGRRVVRAGEISPLADQIGYLVLAASHDAVVGSLRVVVAGKCGIELPATRNAGQENLYVPLVLSVRDWWTAFGLTNVTGENRTVTIRFDSGEFRRLNLAPREARIVTVAGLFGSRRPDLGSAVIENAAGVVGYQLVGQDSADLVGGFLLPGRPLTDLYFPRPGGDGRWSAILAANPLPAPVALQVTAYDGNGTALPAREVVLPAGGEFAAVAGSAELPADYAWVHLAADQAVSGFAAFGTGERMGAFSVSGAVRSSGILADLGDDRRQAGVALLNVSDVPATVTLRAYNDRGQLLSSYEDVIPPHGQRRGPVTAIMPAGLAGATYISFASSVPLVGCQESDGRDEPQLSALPFL